PVNSAISTFMYKGVQYLVTYAGGGLYGGPKGDGIWLFSLNGTMDEVAPAAQSAAAGGGARMPAPGRIPDLANGEAIYRAACTYCHGETGEGGEGGGKAIAVALRVDGIFGVLASGRNTMPAFSASMSSEQMHDVASYIIERLLAD